MHLVSHLTNIDSSKGYVNPLSRFFRYKVQVLQCTFYALLCYRNNSVFVIGKLYNNVVFSLTIALRGMSLKNISFSDRRECLDIDECQNTTICKTREVCVNTPGGYRCNCPIGWIRTIEGCKPSATNKCQRENPCKENEDCSNTKDSPGYRCVCQRKWKIFTYLFIYTTVLFSKFAIKIVAVTLRR